MRGGITSVGCREVVEAKPAPTYPNATQSTRVNRMKQATHNMGLFPVSPLNLEPPALSITELSTEGTFLEINLVFHYASLNIFARIDCSFTGDLAQSSQTPKVDKTP